MKPMRSLGPIVKALREERQITQLQLALEAGYDSGNLSKFEAGKQGVKENTLNKIAEVLGTTRAELLRKAAQQDEMRTAHPLSHSGAERNPDFSYHAATVTPVHTSENTGSNRGSAVPVLRDAQVVDVVAHLKPLSSIQIERQIIGLPGGRPTDFAWDVPDDSMTDLNGGPTSFPKGSIAYFDPSLLHESGDCVLVQLGAHDIAFTRLVRIGGSWVMAPLNSRYPSRDLPLNARVLAVAVGSLIVIKRR